MGLQLNSYYLVVYFNGYLIVMFVTAWVDIHQMYAQRVS
jgi:hypothetical protein